MRMLNRFIIVGLLLVAMAGPALAAVPRTLSYQGTLTDKQGNPVTAAKIMNFLLYEVSSGGVPLWMETLAVTVSNGRFGVVLGKETPLDPSIFTGNTWMGISVQGEPEMAPRQQLTSVAYAMNAGYAETVPPTATLPPGMVVAYAGTVAPDGWLLCNGAQVSRDDYYDLFLAIGTAHGNGDGATTFHLPDYRGRFLRGVDGTAGNDPESATRTASNNGGNTGNSVGTLQNESFKGHNHAGATGTDSPDHNHVTSGAGAVNVQAGPSYGVVANAGGITAGASNSHTHSIAADGGAETRPKNVAVNWIIKY